MTAQGFSVSDPVSNTEDLLPFFDQAPEVMQHNFYHSHKPVQIQGARNTSHLLIGERAKNTVGRYVMGDKKILFQTFLDNTVCHVLHFDHSNLHTSHRHLSYLFLNIPKSISATTKIQDIVI